MGDEVDDKIIQSTQSSLGKYVKRPPLTDKLLKKPPFRFIHDIITSILKNTGFFHGLFEEQELQSENVKDRENKIHFLNKVIFVVGATTGKILPVKPSKVISGQEPEKTNELLQCIALALDNKLSSDEAVQKYKDSVSKSGTSETKSKDVKKALKESSKVKVSSKNTSKNESNAKNEINIKTKTRDINKKESPPKKSIRPATKKPAEKTKSNEIIKKADYNKEVPKTPETKAETLKENKDIILLPNNKSSADTDKNISPTVNADSNLISQSDQTNNKDFNEKENLNLLKEQQLLLLGNGNEKEAENIRPQRIEVNSENQIGVNEDNVIGNNKEKLLAIEKKEKSPERVINELKTSTEPKTIRPISVRPTSSRPGAPRLREKHEETVAGTDNLLIGKVNIIAEHAVQDDDEESSIVIVENNTKPKSEVNSELAHFDSNEHGHLVQQILDSQKEFSQATGKTEIEWQFNAKKARDAINEEIDQLRFNLQALSRVANPLGKLLDHVQEDVEVMRQELQHWTKTYEDAHRELQKQKKSNEEKMKPLRSKIKQLNAEIADKHDKINDLKITIHKNASRIDKLLSNGNKQ